ncbi:E3 ubiquitin-protein ligase TRIM45-like [Argopecten irradians]|uniref:E3 ubiquitin-protein ligase TRIM45-like n=1 Tax=Argopecten irradians TaxID=31199 RepID=UPI0037136D9F
MATAKMPVRLKGQTTCGHHNGKQLDFYYEQCQEPVCLKCVTSLHKGHLLCDLSGIIPQKKEKIRNFIDKTERNAVFDIGNYIATANTLLAENDRTFEKLLKDLKAQTERLKQNLDMLTAESLSIHQKIKDDNTKLIQKYKQDLEICKIQLKQQMQDCKKMLQQGSHIEIYDAECKIDSRLRLPVKPVLDTSIFTQNKNPRKHLELALGICQSVDSVQKTFTVKNQSADVKRLQGPFSKQLKSDGTSWKPGTKTKLLAKVRILREWRSPCNIWAICPTTDDLA